MGKKHFDINSIENFRLPCIELKRKSTRVHVRRVRETGFRLDDYDNRLFIMNTTKKKKKQLCNDIYCYLSFCRHNKHKKSRVAFAGFSLIFFARSSEMIHRKNWIYFDCKFTNKKRGELSLYILINL